MSLPVPTNTTYGVWMRAPSSSGGKDWLGFVTDTCVISQWGKTGMVLQSKVISNRPSMRDLDRKIEEKKSRSYQVLWEYRPGQGWTHAPPPDFKRKKAAPPPPPAQPARGMMASWLSAPDDQEWF